MQDQTNLNLQLEGIFKKGREYFARLKKNKTAFFKKITSPYSTFIYSEEGEISHLINKRPLKQLNSKTYTEFKKKRDSFTDLVVNEFTPAFNYLLENDFQKADPRIWYLDIETIDPDNKKFPSMDDPDIPITHIQIYDNYTDIVYIIMLKNVSNELKKKYPDVKFIVTKTEESLIESFIKMLNKALPTVIYAWNGNFFDFPYITLRARKLKVDINGFSPLGKTTITESEYNNKKEYGSCSKCCFGRKCINRRKLFYIQ